MPSFSRGLCPGLYSAAASRLGGTCCIWRDKAGRYDDVYGEETLTSAHHVIVFWRYESWAIVYAWTGKEVEKNLDTGLRTAHSIAILMAGS